MIVSSYVSIYVEIVLETLFKIYLVPRLRETVLEALFEPVLMLLEASLMPLDRHVIRLVLDIDY